MVTDDSGHILNTGPLDSDKSTPTRRKSTPCFTTRLGECSPEGCNITENIIFIGYGSRELDHEGTIDHLRKIDQKPQVSQVPLTYPMLMERICPWICLKPCDVC